MRSTPSVVVSGDPSSLVLVSDHVDGRSRSAVATVRALAAAGYRPVVTVSGGRSAAALRFGRERQGMPRAVDLRRSRFASRLIVPRVTLNRPGGPPGLKRFLQHAGKCPA